MMIRLASIGYAYAQAGAQHVVLHDVNGHIKQGQSVALVGPSGSGKSTLLHILGLLSMPTQGRYWLHGEDVRTLPEARLAAIRNRSMGFVFQSFVLLPKRNVVDNVCLPLQYRQPRMSSYAMRAAAMVMLDRVGMAEHAEAMPAALSGGQQQRVAIARALVGKPDVILADEPTGALDQATGAQVLSLMLGCVREEGATLVMVTHDQDVAAQCQRILRLQDGRLMDDEVTS